MSEAGLLQSIAVAPISSEAMTPFGAVLRPPPHGQRYVYTEWLGSQRAGMTPRLHTNHVASSSLPHRIEMLERHPYSAQIFLPLDVARYLVVVALAGNDGRPNQTTIRAFVVSGDLGIVYGPGVWHAGATVLERPGSFSVLMWRNDSPEDEEFVRLDVPLQVD